MLVSCLAVNLRCGHRLRAGRLQPDTGAWGHGTDAGERQLQFSTQSGDCHTIGGGRGKTQFIIIAAGKQETCGFFLAQGVQHLTRQR